MVKPNSRRYAPRELEGETMEGGRSGGRKNQPIRWQEKNKNGKFRTKVLQEKIGGERRWRPAGRAVRSKKNLRRGEEAEFYVKNGSNSTHGGGKEKGKYSPGRGPPPREKGREKGNAPCGEKSAGGSCCGGGN